MRPIIIFTLFVLLNSPLNTFAADKGPQKAFFAYGRVKEVVYAIRTTMSISKNAKRDRVLDHWKENPFVIYSLKFRESKLQFKVGDSRIEVPLKGDLYDLKTLNISSSNSVDFMRGRTLVFTPGGVLPVGMKSFKAGGTLAIFPSASETLFFPVFKETGMTLRRGQKWKFTAMPCVLTPSVGLKILQNKLKAQDLPPTIIHSHWRGWKKVNGYECAVIDFSFKVKPEDKFKEGKEDGEYSLKGTSYFSLDLGLPVLSNFEVKSFLTDKKGKKKSYNFHRREVLVSVQPMDGKQITLKKEERPTDTKVDPSLPSKTHKRVITTEPPPTETDTQPILIKSIEDKQSPPTTVSITPTWVYVVIAILIMIILALFFDLKSRRGIK